MGAEMRGPHVGAGVAFQLTDLQVEAEVLIVAQDVVAVVWRAHPGLEDRAHRAIPTHAPGEVLADVPAGFGDVARLAYPVREFPAACGVTEAVAAQNIRRLFLGG